MKKIMIALSSLFVFSISFFPFTSTNEYTFAQEEHPYAKWGQIAMQKVKEKYTTASIIDYLHIGGKKGDQTSTEMFKLWLKDGTREFGVYVTIKFDSKTEEIIDITFRESDR